MKTIIAGSRDIWDYELLCQIVKESGFEITEVVSGMAHGVDSLGLKWAKENGIPDDKVHKRPANWSAFGKAAGHVRNEEMAKVSDALIAIWKDNSPGTYHMIEQASERGLKVHVYEIGVGTYRVNC